MREIIALFLKLGFTAFGGPAAHIAMMRHEVVARRRWLSDQEFLDLVGATNLIPGPNSTEMAIHIGHRRAGWRGLVAAGAAFILPAMCIVTALAGAYVRYGSTPEADWLLYGVKPVIVGIVAHALWALGRTALKNWLTGAAGIAALVLYFAGVNEIAVLAGAGLAVALAQNLSRPGGGAALAGAVGSMTMSAGTVLALLATAAAVPFSVARLFLLFLKIGSVLFGSGYVLLAFLQADFVDRLGWLTSAQLLDAIAVGQFTPGPVFTTATFVGYILGGVPAALAATVGIFLPAFVFVALSHPFIPRMRQSRWAGALLDGVNVASLALMAGVTWRLGQAAIIGPLTALLAVVTVVLLIRLRVNSAWLVAGGALIGLLARRVGG